MNAEALSDSGENNDGTFSFEDSDRFDEMSLCSWVSDGESLCGDWKGWKRTGSYDNFQSKNTLGNVETLIEICSKLVAISFSIETVEESYPNLPEQIQLRIAFWSFPRNDDNIRLYSCLANGSSEEFSRGEQLYRSKAVVEPLQIGFHLSGSVLPYNHGMVSATSDIEQVQSHKPAVVFDRGHVTSCTCTCSPSAAWCCHIVALCLHRIYQSHSVVLRPPVSESLSRLQRNQLQKFSQYLISELPQQLLPYAQKLLDELLLSNDSEINTAVGAPDPTAGPSADNKNQWWMDQKTLRENVRKMLSKFCGPGPFVLEEAYNLQFASTAPPTAAEWSNLLRPLTTHDPEGMWNLLSIVRELFRHRDPNAIELLQLLTQECLSFDQIVVWWFNSRSQSSGRGQQFNKRENNNYKSYINTASTEMTKHACASFCDELVVLWRLACLYPVLCAAERQSLKERLDQWHSKTIEKAKNARYLGERIFSFGRATENFPGFKIAIEACGINWSEVLLPSCQIEASSTESSGHTSTSSVEPKCVQDLDEDIQTLFTRAEALLVHGYPEGRELVELVAERILAEASEVHEKQADDASCFIRTSVVQASFLCSALSHDSCKRHLAFKIGLHGLVVLRKPAKSKALEVKLANQETELVGLLNQLPHGPAELAVVRERARLLCQGKLERGKTVLPMKLAIFLFQVLSKNSAASPEDKELGFKTGLTALNMKANILETEYPMLCEGIRRQRGELALALLDYSKDSMTCLQQVKECLLDKKRYRLEAHFKNKRYFNNDRGRKTNAHAKVSVCKRSKFGQRWKRRSSNDDDETRRPVNGKKSTTSRSTSSESRQSSWSSCLSDDLSPREEFRAARDSGRDSENDTHEPMGHSSQEYSEGEILGDYSPGEEGVKKSNSGLMRPERGNMRSKSTFCEGTSNLPIDIPNDRNSVADAPKTISENVTKSIPQSDSQSRILQDSDENHVLQNESQPREEDCWVDDDGWIETGNPIPQNDNEYYIPQNDNHNKRYDNKYKQTDNRRKTGGKSRSHHVSLEAEAHFTFELAKKVLVLAGGATPSPNSIFGQTESATNSAQSVCNRSLQLCAFELGLFALGLHNMTCFNWLSRTYSAHVSWISTQALELGNVALGILLEKWENHLTPSEVASIADRASKSNDQTTVQKAAQLALACLSMAHTLNPGYIRSSLCQCKEQGSDLLEQACNAVESAAGGGGVYPEVLFEVAKLWEYLYEQTRLQGNDEERGLATPEMHAGQEDYNARVAHEPRGSHEARGQHDVPEFHDVRGPREIHDGQPLQPVIIKMPRHVQNAPHFYRETRNYGLFIPLPTPEQLVQQQISQQVQHLMEVYQGGRGQSQVAYQLASAYRVGMLALENLGRRPVDDPPHTMLAENPPHKAEIHWLCQIANKVGAADLQRFCLLSVNSIHSPFVLHDLALEAAGLMAKSNPNQIAFHLRSPTLSPLVQKCLINYAQCVQHNLQGLPKSEYAEFVELVMRARSAYCMAPGGMTQFNDLLQSVRRSTAKKKDLWQKITTALAHQQK